MLDTSIPLIYTPEIILVLIILQKVKIKNNVTTITIEIIINNLKIEKISDYIREATIFGTLFVFQDFYNLTNEWIRVNSQIHKIGTNINQIAHRVNSNPEKLELYSDDLIFIKNQIKKIKMDNEELIKKVFKSFKIKQEVQLWL